MNKCGIKRGSYIIINTERKEPADGEIFAAIRDNTFIIRKYHNDIEGRHMSAESTRIPEGLSMQVLCKQHIQLKYFHNQRCPHINK